VATETLTGYAVALIAVERTSGSVSFSLNLIVAIMADEFKNSGMNGSGMRSDCVLFDMDLLIWHLVVEGFG
jgi:hypothetical protein